MFGFLKGTDAHPTLQLEGQLGDVVKFSCKSSLSVGKTVQASALLPDGQKMEVAMVIVESLGRSRFTGRITEPVDGATTVAQFFAEKAQELHFKLADQPTHHLRAFVVRSQQIPNFKAMTRHISLVECHIVTTGPMTVGQKLGFQLELEGKQTIPLELKGEVITCEDRLAGTWVVGIKFGEMSEKTHHILEAFLARLKQAPH